MKHTLPELNYDYNALEPTIDAQTMQIHHSKHHQGYVNNLNNALNGYHNFQQSSLEDILKSAHEVPEAIKQAVINNAGGHHNHSLFWKILSPQGGGEPKQEIAQKMLEKWGTFESFQGEFNTAATSRFGSGWAWLVVTAEKELKITSTKNQDSPLMEGLTPLLGLDVWEHAYYLQYQNKRAEYVKNFWNIVNWEQVNNNYLSTL